MEKYKRLSSAHICKHNAYFNALEFTNALRYALFYALTFGCNFLATLRLSEREY